MSTELRKAILEIDTTYDLGDMVTDHFLLPNFYLDRLVDFVASREKEIRLDEVGRISKLTAGRSETPENQDNATWQGGFNFARNNLKRYKLDRIRDIKARGDTPE